MDDKNILELHVEQQDTDGTAKEPQNIASA